MRVIMAVRVAVPDTVPDAERVRLRVCDADAVRVDVRDADSLAVALAGLRGEAP